MRKAVRYILKTLGWVGGVLMALWILLWVLVELNEDKLIARIASVIHQKTRGYVHIQGASVSLIRTFPILSLQLSDVVIRDSLYSFHKKDFFQAADVYLRISLRDLLKGRSALGRITVRNGSINIFTDSTGHSNEYILSDEKKPEGQKRSSVPLIILNNVRYQYDNMVKKKFFEGTIRELNCGVTVNKDFVVMNVSIDALMNRFALNTRKGSYAKNSDIAGAFQLTYSLAEHDLLVNHVGLNINGQPFYFDGFFKIDRNASDFSLAITTHDIEFEKAAKLLNDTLERRLSAYAFGRPVSPEVTITGRTVSRFGPDVRIKMQVDMSSVLRVAGITSFRYDKGTSDVDITIVSSEKAKDTTNGDLDGTIRVHNTDISYLPRNFLLKDCNGAVHFNSNDILIDSLSALAGQTRLLLDGRTKNFITLGSNDPGRLGMNWKLSSPDLHISDFKAFLSKGKFSSSQSALDKLFSAGDIQIALSAPRMDYKNFHATNAVGQVILKQSGIQIQKVSFSHARGYMELSGELKNGVKTNPLSLHTRMKNIDVPILFTAFDNFGQDAITAANLKGSLTADVQFSTAISDQAKVSAEDSKGSVDFLLENGELDNFTPLIEVSSKAFKKQDFSKIKFADLKNKLDVSGTTFIVNPMEIRSSAFTLFVEGVYDFKKGTDMSIRFPIKNLTRSQAHTDLSDDAKVKKGIGLRLRAKTGTDGKLKVSWDPFRKSIRNRDQAKDSL